MRSAAFSPDGSRIVTASDDKTARIWDAASGQEICMLRGYGDSAGKLGSAAGVLGSAEIWSTTFSPDGTRIVTASHHSTAHIWDVPFATMSVHDLIIEVCMRRLRGMTKMTRDDMRLAGYADTLPEIDVADGLTTTD